MKNLSKSIGTWEVWVAGVALVVAASTMVTDFTGFFTLGAGFAIALVLGFVLNLLLAFSAAELSVAHPRAGALYDYTRNIFSGKTGHFLGVFLGLSFFGMFAFTASGETAAGAYGLQALFHSDLDIRYFISSLMVLATIPNLLGLKTTAWVSAVLLLLMLGIRWFFGLSGLMGAGGEWEWSHLIASHALQFSGERGILTSGLALAFWSFVGIEFACSLAEEVRSPRKSIPRGLVLGLVGILITSLVMGIGVTGVLPLDAWDEIVNGALGQQGEAPQLAVGQVFFGKTGYYLMALASVSATLGTLTVAFAAMPRIIYSIARDGRFFGPLSKPFGKLHPKYNTPVNATLLTLVIYLIPSLYSSAVVEWLYSAAYVWILLYMVFHLLAIINRYQQPSTVKTFSTPTLWFITTTGLLCTAVGLYYAFEGAHIQYGGKALVVLIAALAATGISFAIPHKNTVVSAAKRDKVRKAA